MGIFTRKQAPQQTRPAGPRDIPSLNPTFYEKALAAAGKPVTAGNIAAIAGLTAANLTLNANQWLEQIGTAEARARWQREFTITDPPDSDRLVGLPDRMIDFLWAWDGRSHRALHDFMATMQGTAVSASQKFGAELPLDMWGTAQ